MNKTKKLKNAYVIKACNGPGGCPNTIFKKLPILNKIELIFKNLEYNHFILRKINGILRNHHQFKVSISCCPNACSMPQISDLGIIAAAPLIVTENQCSGCWACTDECIEDAIVFDDTIQPKIIEERCVYCGKCATVCPMGTIKIKKKGYRILIGGKLGRHPRLATELPGIFSEAETLKVTEKCIKLFMENYSGVKRFADLFNIYDKKNLIETIMP